MKFLKITFVGLVGLMVLGCTIFLGKMFDLPDIATGVLAGYFSAGTWKAVYETFFDVEE